MDNESAESIEPMEEVPLGLGESALDRLVHDWRREAGSCFQRRGKLLEGTICYFLKALVYFTC